jgi:Uma2 family endonuclease
VSMYKRREPVLITADQYERLVEDDRFISEVSRGRLIRSPRPGALHARVAFELGVQLKQFVQAHDLGTVEVESGFRLWGDPITVRGPDVAFISKARLPATLPESWWPFAPDLAIEIVSRGKSLAKLNAKIFEYFDTGTRQVWVVEPRTRSVMVYRSLAEISIIRAPAALEGGDLLPGLVLPIDAFLPAEIQ